MNEPHRDVDTSCSEEREFDVFGGKGIRVGHHESCSSYDTETSDKVDNSYYKQLLLNKGILEIDQNLALDSATKNLVSAQATGSNLLTLFNNAMVKMSTIQVLTGTQGKIRKSCRPINQL